MSYNENDEFEVLHALRIKGMTQPEEIAESTVVLKLSTIEFT